VEGSYERIWGHLKGCGNQHGLDGGKSEGMRQNSV